MNEFAVANIDAYMTEGAAQGVEENQVTGLQFRAVDLPGVGSLLLGLARQDQPHRLFVHGFDKAAAIKTGFRCIAAAPVGHSR